MARKFKELLENTPLERRAASKAGADKLRAEMALDEVREALNLTQDALAEILHVNQPATSKIERESDMFLSTLRKFIQAMGGVLEIRAVFPDGAVRINQFEELHENIKPVRQPEPATAR